MCPSPLCNSPGPPASFAPQGCKGALPKHPQASDACGNGSPWSTPRTPVPLRPTPLVTQSLALR